MIFGISVLLSVYATALTAGLAYQQIDPIVKLVPGVAKFVESLMEDLGKRWKRFTLPDSQKRIEKVGIFLDSNRELAETILRKLAVRLALGWGLLGLSLVAIVLMLGVLLQPESGAQIIQLSGNQVVSGWFALLLPALAGVGAALSIQRNASVLIVSPEILAAAKELVANEFLARQWMSLEEAGRGMLSDLASISQIGRSLSALSHSERFFIERYIDSLALLRRMQALLAAVEWQRLETEAELPDELMEAAEELWQKDKFDEAFFYYAEVINLLHEERRLQNEQWSLAFVRVRLGGCYGHNGDVRSALKEFEKAKKLDRKVAKIVCSENFDRVIKPINAQPAFRAFCSELKSIDIDYDSPNHRMKQGYEKRSK